MACGVADFRAYIDKVLELGIEENCKRYGEPCVAGIEMGARGDRPDRFQQESAKQWGTFIAD